MRVSTYLIVTLKHGRFNLCDAVNNQVGVLHLDHGSGCNRRVGRGRHRLYRETEAASPRNSDDRGAGYVAKFLCGCGSKDRSARQSRLAVDRDRDCDRASSAAFWNGNVAVKSYLVCCEALVCDPSENKNPCFILVIDVSTTARDRSREDSRSVERDFLHRIC